MSAIHPSELAFITKHAPFDRMELEHVIWMMERMDLGYYAAGEVIVSPDQGAVDRFLVIKQGIVHGEQNVAKASEADTWLELMEGECFPLGALLANRRVASVYRAGTDAFCYELPAADFREWIANGSRRRWLASPICWSIPSKSFRRSTVIPVSSSNRWPVRCR